MIDIASPSVAISGAIQKCRLKIIELDFQPAGLNERLGPVSTDYLMT
jgi:hypothetical protein